MQGASFRQISLLAVHRLRTFWAACPSIPLYSVACPSVTLPLPPHLYYQSFHLSIFTSLSLLHGFHLVLIQIRVTL
ncbi:hypothetical protein B0F90DRAFT_1765319, partial [Multifurca ochricompacta]